MTKRKRRARDSRQRTLTTHLNIYYDAIIASIRDAEAILIFGPGEAKGELKKRLKKANLSGRIVGMETVDKMTDHQIAAKVRQHFRDNGDQPLDRDGERVGLRSGPPIKRQALTTAAGSGFSGVRPIIPGRVTPHRKKPPHSLASVQWQVRERTLRKKWDVPDDSWRKAAARRLVDRRRLVHPCTRRP